MMNGQFSDDVVAAAEEAVRIRREYLLELHSPTRQVLLAHALSILANVYAGAGDHEAQLRTGEEALGIERRLAAADPATYTVPIARTLILAAAGYCQLERYEEAEPHCREAVALLHKSAEQVPGLYAFGVPMAAELLATLLDMAGRADEAAEVRRAHRI
jgi:tetratricopeptide (TPR) repeat protein